MGCKRKKGVYKRKRDAKRHGAITYGQGNFTVRRRKGGWSAYEK